MAPTLELDVSGLTAEQAAAVMELSSVLTTFGDALIACQAAGLEPVEAFRACGIKIPAMAAPMVNRMLSSELG